MVVSNPSRRHALPSPGLSGSPTQIGSKLDNPFNATSRPYDLARRATTSAAAPPAASLLPRGFCGVGEGAWGSLTYSYDRAGGSAKARSGMSTQVSQGHGSPAFRPGSYCARQAGQ
jgi:hypothetical protein